jgi:hypothetical protein
MPVAGLILVCLVTSEARSLELKNVRPSYGPLGAPRSDNKFLPKDYLFITYDIEGLKVDEKTGKVNFMTTIETIDLKGNKTIFKKETPNLVEPVLGPERLLGDLQVLMGGQAPGKYMVRLSVTDRVSKDSKSFEYPFEILKEEFGVVGVNAPSIGFPGQQYQATFGFVDMPLDAKNKPQVDLGLRVLDNKGKPVSKPLLYSWPRDLPEDVDLKKENFVAVPFYLYLNRSGSFTLELEAIEKTTKKKINMRFPLTVVDLNALGK